MRTSGSVDHSCRARLTGAASRGSIWKTAGVSTAATYTNSHPTRTRRMSMVPVCSCDVSAVLYACVRCQAFGIKDLMARMRHDSETDASTAIQARQSGLPSVMVPCRGARHAEITAGPGTGSFPRRPRSRAPQASRLVRRTRPQWAGLHRPKRCSAAPKQLSPYLGPSLRSCRCSRCPLSRPAAHGRHSRRRNRRDPQRTDGPPRAFKPRAAMIYQHATSDRDQATAQAARPPGPRSQGN